MRRLPLFLALLAFAAAPVAAQDALAIGAPVPLADQAFERPSGGSVTLAGEMGPRGLAVLFWSNTCPWVTRYEERVLDLAREYGEAGIGFVLLNPNDPAAFPGEGPDAIRQRESGYPMPYAVDAGSRAARAFGATRAPQVFLFNANGALIYGGTIDDSPSSAAQARDRYFRDALAAVVADEAPVVEKTQAFGCTIRFTGQ